MVISPDVVASRADRFFEWKKMAEDLLKLYNDFAHEVAHEYRYSLSEKSQHFLAQLLTIANQNLHIATVGRELYRARSNAIDARSNEAHVTPWAFDQMKPVRNVVSEGRANPSNVCALYLASTIGTALSEVRPSVQHPVTVGTFVITRELRLVDLTALWNVVAWARQTEPLWIQLSTDFSKPLNPQNQSVHYAKTQIIAESFKRHGFDGIRYRSQFFSHETSLDTNKAPGMNYVLFDLDSAHCRACEVYAISEQHVVYEKFDTDSGTIG